MNNPATYNWQTPYVFAILELRAYPTKLTKHYEPSKNDYETLPGPLTAHMTFRRSSCP
jgi:hypothetical protein